MTARVGLGTVLALLLRIALLCRAAAAGTCSSPYTIVSGDNLDGLPNKCGCAGTAGWASLCRSNWDAIQQSRVANNLPACSDTPPATLDEACCKSIYPGTQLDLPVSCTDGQAAPASPPGRGLPSPGPPGASPPARPGVSPPVQPTTDPKPKKKGVGVGIIIAGAVGGVLVLAVVLLVLCCCFGKRILRCWRAWRASRRPPNTRRPKLLAAAAKPQLERQVFISHTGQDEAAKNFAASLLKPMLEQAGVQVYMDFTDLQPGCRWPEQLVLAAANSAVFVAVLSRQYYTRYWCMLELDLALNAQRLAAQGSGKFSRTGSQRLAAAAGGRDANTTGSSNRELPQIIPVFYNPPDVVIPSPRGSAHEVDGTLVRQHWDSEDNLGKLRREDEQLQSEWTRWVDSRQWAANLLRVKNEFHGVRRVDTGAKDVDRRVAEEVTAAVVRLMGTGVGRSGNARVGDDTVSPV